MKKGPRPDLRPMREKSLEELEGYIAGEPPIDTYLVRTIHELRRKPIGQFTVEDLRITIGQGRGVPYLLPLALECLEREPLAAGHYYPGDLLMSVLDAEAHWGANTDFRSRARRIVERALEQLEAVRPIDSAAGELPEPDEPDQADREHLEPLLRGALAKLISGAV